MSEFDTFHIKKFTLIVSNGCPIKVPSIPPIEPHITSIIHFSIY